MLWNEQSKQSVVGIRRRGSELFLSEFFKKKILGNRRTEYRESRSKNVETDLVQNLLSKNQKQIAVDQAVVPERRREREMLAGTPEPSSSPAATGSSGSERNSST